MSKKINNAVRKHVICISALKFGIFNRKLLPDSQDGWGICCLPVETSFCRPCKNSKTSKLNQKKAGYCDRGKYSGLPEKSPPPLTFFPVFVDFLRSFKLIKVF